MSRLHIARPIAALATGFALVARLTTVDAGADLKGSYTSLDFSSGIAGVEAELDDVADVLRLHTELDGRATTGAERIVFVYGIGHGSEVFAPVVSETVILTPGAEPFISEGSGPIDSPWDAFDNPIIAFEDPALGFEDPALGFDNPIIAFEEPALGYEEPALGFEDPALGLEAIWGNGNIGIDPGDYGLVLFTMRYPESGSTGTVQYSSAIVPFEVREGA